MLTRYLVTHISFALQILPGEFVPSEAADGLPCAGRLVPTSSRGREAPPSVSGAGHWPASAGGRRRHGPADPRPELADRPVR